jgi:hypothetical protein
VARSVSADGAGVENANSNGKKMYGKKINT